MASIRWTAVWRGESRLPRQALATVAPGAAVPAALGRAWSLLLELLARAAEAAVVLAIASDLVVTIAAVISRHFFSHPLVWTDDIAGICLNLIGFLGGPVAIRRGRGMSLTLVLDRLPARFRGAVEAAGLWFCLAFVGVAATTFGGFLTIADMTRTAGLALPETVDAVWLPVGYALLGLFVVDRLLRLPLRHVAAGAAAGAVAAVPLAVVHGGAIAVLGYAFAVTLLAGVPIALVLGIAAVAFIHVDQTIPLSTIPVAFQSGI